VSEFFVPGRARTKGSLEPKVTRAKGGVTVVNMVESVKLSGPWKLKIIDTICREHGWNKPRVIRQRGRQARYEFDHEPLFPGPVEVRFEVRFDREHREELEALWPILISYGDGDKLERNVWDALTQSGLIVDDRMVVAWAGRKRFVRENEMPGLHCRVTEVR
jgi:Holliday junction resolvase RusA-like endonuclease